MFQIGFISSSDSDALVPQLRPLVPDGTRLVPVSIADAIGAVTAQAFPLLVMAMDHDDWDAGLDAVKDLHAAGARARAPVFALVPRAVPGALAHAFRLQVADAATLPMDPMEVQARLAMLVQRRQVAMARADESRRLREMALVDPLTGLASRYHLEQLLPGAFAAARSSGAALSVLMIDVDGLKPINDQWGHAEGDRLLGGIGRLLMDAAAGNGILGRMGGDEVLAVLPGFDRGPARLLADRLLASVEAGSPAFEPRGRPVTVSIGLARMTGDDPDHAALIRRADAALYAAKRSGRNRVVEAD